MLSRSLPNINGLFSRAHIEKCVTKSPVLEQILMRTKMCEAYRIRQTSFHRSYVSVRKLVE